MIQLDDYKKEDGSTDWWAYKAAQKANGEICRECGDYIFGLRDHGFPRLCVACKGMYLSPTLATILVMYKMFVTSTLAPYRKLLEGGEASHETYVRCPKCRHQFNPGQSDYYELYSEGEHEVYCGMCDHEFEITTHVSFLFVSPPFVQESETEDEDDI